MSVDFAEVVKAAFAEGMRVGKEYKKFLIIEDEDVDQEWKKCSSKEEIEDVLKKMPSDEQMKARAERIYKELSRKMLKTEEIPVYICSSMTNGIFLR